MMNNNLGNTGIIRPANIPTQNTGAIPTPRTNFTAQLQRPADIKSKVEENQLKELLCVCAVGAHIPFHQVCDFFVAVVVLVTAAFFSGREPSHLCKVLLGDFPVHANVKALGDVGWRSVLELDKGAVRGFDMEDLSCDLHADVFVGGHFPCVVEQCAGGGF